MGGFFAVIAAGLVMRTWNAGDHQTRWGVLGAAVGALVEGVQVVGVGSFRIFDGAHEVGAGSIG